MPEVNERRLLIISGGEAELEQAAERLIADGGSVHHGFDFGERSWRLEGSRTVCLGVVASEDEAAAAVLAAARGASLAIAVVGERSDLVWRLYEDLRRLGPVEFGTGDASNPLEALDPEQLQLLELLADGVSLAAAAEELCYSRRTVNRRLAAARERLGVRTTAEALVLVREHLGRLTRDAGAHSPQPRARARRGYPPARESSGRGSPREPHASNA